MICQDCQSEIAGNLKFCPKCGAKIASPALSTPTLPDPSGWICPRCGTENPGSARFCKKDGYQFPTAGGSNLGDESAAARDTEEADPVTRPFAKPAAEVPGQGRPVDSGRGGLEEDVGAPAPGVPCPRCGTLNSRSARFCKKDGFPLRVGPDQVPRGTGYPLRPSPIPGPALRPDALGPRRPSAALLVGALVATLVVAAGAGGAAYWLGYVGDRQGTLAESINGELQNKGLSTIRVAVARDWTATASGTATTQAQKDQAVALIRQHQGLKSVTETIQVVADPAEAEKGLNKALADAGLSQVSAQVSRTNDQLVAVLGGILNAGDEAKLEQALAAAPAIKDFKRNYQVAFPPPAAAAEASLAPPETPPAQAKVVNPAEIERRVAQALSANGFRSVSVRVDAQGNVRLSGKVASQAEDNRVVETALAVDGVLGVDDALDIAAAAPASAVVPPAEVVPRLEIPRPAPPPPRPPQDPAKLEGDINRALRNGGLDGITAQVGEDFAVTLKGAATSDEGKRRAFQIAKGHKGVRGVRDKIFVVEQ